MSDLLIYLCLERESLFVSEYSNPQVKALLLQFITAWVSVIGYLDDLVSRHCHS